MLSPFYSMKFVRVFQFIENGNNSFRISLEFKETHCDIIILQHATAWCAEIKQTYIESLSNEFKIEVSKYCEKIHESLLRKSKNVEFSFTENEFIMYLKAHNGINIKYFHCTLQPTEFHDCAVKLLEKMYDERNTLYKKCSELTQNQRVTNEAKIQLENKLRELTERKATEEQEHYNNFVLLLNEKKKRIQHLHEQLEAFRRGRPTNNPEISIKNKKLKKENQLVMKEEISDSDHSSSNDEKEYNTDEEKEQYNGTNNLKENINEEPVPSTSKASALLDDSPPRHLLPKRIKIKQKGDDEDIMNTSVSDVSKNDEYKNEAPVLKLEENSPDVDFSTQDLLDHI